MALVVDTIGKIKLPTGEDAYGLILTADSAEEARALAHLWAERVVLSRAEKEDEADEPTDVEIEHMKALYDGEGRAGILDSREEYEAKLRDAGRGHLLGS